KKFRVLNKYICREKLGLDKRIKIIFTLSSLVKQKGHIYAIEAIKYLKNKRTPNFVYFIGGSGNLKDSLEEKIKKINLEDKIKLIGFIPEEKISLWMNAIDIFLLPSLYEGNPTVMFEALGCGKPFVGSSVGGIPEIIINDKIGLISKPRDSKDLSRKIFFALNKKWDNKFIANYAKQFTWKKICKKIIKIYERCLYEHSL
ncbi:MAG: glycosyltransferase family 4 protein, partial [Candidatus Methanomethylicia archaeon]